jgi:hypothetical protein
VVDQKAQQYHQRRVHEAAQALRQTRGLPGLETFVGDAEPPYPGFKAVHDDPIGVRQVALPTKIGVERTPDRQTDGESA